MDKQGLKYLICLCLWVFFAQGMGAYSFAAAVHTVDPAPEFKESSSSVPVYIDQINIYQTESAPQKEFILGSLPFPNNISVIPGKQNQKNSSYELFLRDQKYLLKIQLFPFHFFL